MGLDTTQKKEPSIQTLVSHAKAMHRALCAAEKLMDQEKLNAHSEYHQVFDLLVKIDPEYLD